MAANRTFSIIKPDATRRNLTGAVTKMLEEAGLRVVASKRIQMTREQAEGFYGVHRERPFFNDLVAFNGMIDEEAITSILTRHSDRLSVVAAPVRLDSPDHATADDIGNMIDTLKSMFDYVVVDTSGVFDDNALTALDRTDTIILVATLDIPALKGLKLATGTLDLLNFPRDTWKFVLNRADGKVGLTVDEFESTLGLKANTTLVSSREVLTAVNRGEALVRAYPSHPNSKAITSLAHSFIGVSDTGPKGRKASGSRLRLRKD